jgi:siroheme synthase-like protein
MYTKQTKEINTLYPIFLKLEEMKVLLVGAGEVGLEKLNSLLSNAPATSIHIVSETVSENVLQFASEYSTVTINQRAFDPIDLQYKDLVIIAVNNKETSKTIKQLANEKGLLVNVADTPELCDFYLGSIVQKGNLKIAISTNGKSPTMAKRLKEVLYEMIPADMETALQNLHVIRQTMKGDFKEKVKQLNELTRILIAKKEICKPE